MLSKNEILRNVKQMMLPEIGQKGQEQLKLAKVLVIGAGGLGCPILSYLNAIGVGTIGIVDGDTVAFSNLHRQVLFTSEDISQSKAKCAAKRLLEQNQNTTIHVYDCMIEPNNCEELIKNYDYIVDGCDNFETRYLVNDTCVQLGKPLIYGSILGFQGQVAVFNHSGGKNLRDVFPEPPHSEDVPSCDLNGVLGTFPGVIGTIMAQETAKLILELPVLRNELMILNTLNWEVLKVKF